MKQGEGQVRGRPKITKPGITPVKLDPSRQGPFAKAVLDMPVTPIEPVAIVEGKDYRAASCRPATRSYVENARNQLFTLTQITSTAAPTISLVCLALDVLKVSGAGKRTPEQVARQLYELGVTIDTACSKDRATVTVAGIDRNLESAWRLLREWLADRCR